MTVIDKAPIVEQLDNSVEEAVSEPIIDEVTENSTQDETSVIPDSDISNSDLDSN